MDRNELCLQIKEVVNHFKFDGVATAYEKYGNGHINDTFKVTATNGDVNTDYIVQRINTDIFTDPEMLMNGPYPYDLKLRIRGKRGHLSNRECADLAAELAGQGTTHFLLAHLSEENNHPELAYKAVTMEFGDYGIIAGKDVQLNVLKRSTPSKLYIL